MHWRRIGTTLLLTSLPMLAGCVDPNCPGVRLVYNGTREGPVVVLATAPASFRNAVHVMMFPTVAAAREQLTGSCPYTGGTAAQSLFNRSLIDDGMTVRAWIDLDRGEYFAQQCNNQPRAAADCVPDPGEPRGEIPPPPHPAGPIDLVINDDDPTR